MLPRRSFVMDRNGLQHAPLFCTKKYPASQAAASSADTKSISQGGDAITCFRLMFPHLYQKVLFQKANPPFLARTTLLSASTTSPLSSSPSPSPSRQISSSSAIFISSHRPPGFLCSDPDQRRRRQRERHNIMGNTASNNIRSSTTSTPPAISGAAGITTDDQSNAAARRAQGEFVRGVSSARNWITAKPPSDKHSSPSSSSSLYYYPPATGRYHLYVAYNCPWCHRVLLARALLGLEDAISVDVLYPNRSSDDEPLGGNLWKFCPQGQVGMNGKHTQFPECTVDTVYGKSCAKEIYERTGIMDQKSVPILLDKETNTVVNNESAEIVRMFGTAMKEFGTHSHSIDLYPANDQATQMKIDALNDWIYKTIANGSYKAGFSSNQQVYETAYQSYFDALEELNTLLEDQTFLTGPNVTEADVRLFPPLFRHDPVYYNRFKLNEKYLWEYPNIWRWMGDMMSLPGMEPVSNAGYLAHCKQGYFGRTGNGTIPVGPKGYPECYKNREWPPLHHHRLTSPSSAEEVDVETSINNKRRRKTRS